MIVLDYPRVSVNMFGGEMHLGSEADDAMRTRRCTPKGELCKYE